MVESSSIYPAVLNLEFNVYVNIHKPSELRIQLYFITGQLVYFMDELLSESDNAILVNPEQIEGYSGVLLYRMFVDGAVLSSGKLIKQ